jgi:iron complex transport system substrate-binding protein
LAEPEWTRIVIRLASHASDVPRRLGFVRILSLLPSATEIIARLGLVDSLVGRSNECTYPPEVLDRPVVTAARIDPRQLESVEIDRQVREAIADGRSLYAVDAALIDELRPELIVTQDLCAVCAVSSGELGSACPVGAEVISLDPSTLDEVAASIETLASRLGVSERGGRSRARCARRSMTSADRPRPPSTPVPENPASSSPNGSTHRSCPATGCPR